MLNRGTKRILPSRTYLWLRTGGKSYLGYKNSCFSTSHRLTRDLLLSGVSPTQLLCLVIDCETVGCGQFNFRCKNFSIGAVHVGAFNAGIWAIPIWPVYFSVEERNIWFRHQTQLRPLSPLGSVTCLCPFSVTGNGHGRVPLPRWYMVEVIGASAGGPIRIEMTL